MAIIELKVPNAALTEVADTLYQGGRPKDPPLVKGDPLAMPPVEEVPAPPLSDQECIHRWIVREVSGRVFQRRREFAANAAAAAVAEPAGVE